MNINRKSVDNFVSKGQSPPTHTTSLRIFISIALWFYNLKTFWQFDGQKNTEYYYTEERKQKCPYYRDYSHGLKPPSSAAFCE